MEFGLEYVAARPKKVIDDTAPLQQGMRDDKPFTRNPSTDQKRVRREMQRNEQRRTAAETSDWGWPLERDDNHGQLDAVCPNCGSRNYSATGNTVTCSGCGRTDQTRTATKENRMPTEAELLAKIASATTRVEQRQYAIELEELRTSKVAARRRERELDLANTVVENRWPTAIATTALNRHTAASDWLDEVEPAGADHTAVERHMRATANTWFDRQPDAVKADMDEMTARTHAWARREASQFGIAAQAGYEAAVGQVEHLHGRHVAKLRAQADVNDTQPLADTHITDSGSSLPRGVDNKDTFDDSLFGPAGDSDPKSTGDKGLAPSLSEGGPVESDQAQSVTEPDAGTQTYDKSSGNSTATDYLDGTQTPSSNGKGETFSSRRVQADDQDSQDWDTSEVPSLAEGGPIEGDEAQSPVDPDSDGTTTYDKSNGAGTATDYLDGSTYPKQGRRQASEDSYDIGYAEGLAYKGDNDFSQGVDDAVDGRPLNEERTGTLAQIAASIEADEARVGHALSSRAVPFLAAMKALPSKAASIGGISGEAVVRYFLAAADLRGPHAAQHVAALNRVLADLPCPDYPGQSYDESYGFCSCGGNHIQTPGPNNTLEEFPHTSARKTAGDVPPEFKEQQKSSDDSDSDGDKDSDSSSDSDSDDTPDFIQDKIDDSKGKESLLVEAVTCSCATNSDGTRTTMLCPQHASEDPCATMAAVTGQRRRGSIVRGVCSACGWSAKGATASKKTAGEYGGGSPKEGDTAKCHKDGGPIQFFDGAWYHLSGGPSHNDVYPATPKEQADKDKTAAVDTSRLAAFRQRVAANLATVTAAEQCPATKKVQVEDGGRYTRCTLDKGHKAADGTECKFDSGKSFPAPV